MGLKYWGGLQPQSPMGSAAYVYRYVKNCGECTMVIMVPNILSAASD